MEPDIPRAIVVANGMLPHLDLTRQRVSGWLAEEPGMLVVAANGGTHNALALGLTPAVIVGDLDSLDTTLREQLAADGCQFVAAPPRKDETDLEMALRYAVGRGIRRMRILGALGGRLDQTLANILLLTLPVLEQVEAHIVEGRQTAWLIRGADEVQGAAGDTLSLIALRHDAHGVTTEGLEYPLADTTLPFGLSLGVSNVLTGQRARIVVREGLLLAIHTVGGT